MSLDVLVVGGGYIGARHLRCFQQTVPCVVSMCELMDDCREHGVEGFARIDDAVERTWDLIVVATPAYFHIKHALAVKD